MERTSIKNRGFSLIELMITLAIGAVLLAVGLPSFKDFMANSRMSETHNAMVYSLQVARSASVERISAVGLCVSSEPMANDASCTHGADYNQGWFVYVDSDGNGQRNAGEEILERTAAPGPAFTFTPDQVFENQIYFSDAGASINVGGVPMSGSIELDFGDGTQVRILTVSANGRVSTETP